MVPQRDRRPALPRVGMNQSNLLPYLPICHAFGAGMPYGKERMMQQLTIRARLLILIGAMLSACLVIGLTGLNAQQRSVAGLNTVYLDRVVPLRDLKLIADLCGEDRRRHAQDAQRDAQLPAGA